MELLTPSVEISESFFEALEKGYVDKSRGKITTDKDTAICLGSGVATATPENWVQH